MQDQAAIRPQSARAGEVRKVPFFNYPALFQEHEAEYLETVRDVLSRGAFIMQRDLEEFERGLAQYVGCKHAIGVANGTAALILSLKVSGIKPGDEVIVSSHTFVATAAAVHHVGAVPVLCDCAADGMMDAESARRMITLKTRAIMPSQLNGRTADMDAIGNLAREHNLIIVEDSCQALGAKFKGRPAGLFGVTGSFSFYPAKTLGAFGDAGAIVTDSDEAAAAIRMLRDHGRGPDGKVRLFGHNERLDNLQAAILALKLPHYDQSIARRREIARMYQERLGDLGELLLPPPPADVGDHYDVFQNYEIQAERRDELRDFLGQRGIGTIVQWAGWMVHQFEDLGLRADAPYAEAMSRRYLLLPMHPLLSNHDVECVSTAIRKFYLR